MAGDWIKMRVALTYDLKVMQIARLLNGDEHFLNELAEDADLQCGQCNVQMLHTYVIGALHRLWCAVQEVTSDGNLKSLDRNDINCLVGCTGFCDALVEVGWLDSTTDEHGRESLQVHNWEAHNGDSAKKRALGSKRVDKHRGVKRSGVTGRGDGCNAKTLPEKRREEIDTNVSTPIVPKGAVGFERFWEEYPKKVGKDAARKAWLKKRPPIDACLKAVEAQRKSEAWRKDLGQYIPNPATWLNQGRWQDEVHGGNGNKGGTHGWAPDKPRYTDKDGNPINYEP